MEIRDEDIDAAITAVSWMQEGTLSEVRIRHDGELIFAAHMDEHGKLIIDPDAMAPEFARKIMGEPAIMEPEEPKTSDVSQSSDDLAAAAVPA